MNFFQNHHTKTQLKLFIYKYMIFYKSLSIEKKGVAKKIAIGKRFCFNFLFIIFLFKNLN